MIADVVTDSFIDSVRLLPFLFLTYLAMEYLEHKASGKMQRVIGRSGKAGPFIGAVMGIFPQCGFSAAAANLYAGGIVSVGTLLAIFLSTSDEMLPILISENVGAATIGKILAVKVLAAAVAGLLTDFVFCRKKRDVQIEHLCEQHHCHCEKGIWRSALHHTAEIFVYVLLISFVIDLLITLVGKDALGNLILNRPIVGELIAGLIGLIPNCAVSVAVTQLYLDGVLSAGAMMAGLLTGAGVGVLVLIRVNDNQKENGKIIAMLYLAGVLAGILTGFLGVTF